MMKRLLLSGRKLALATLGTLAVLFSFEAKADDAFNLRVLSIEILGSTKARPENHMVLRVMLPFESRHECQGAQERIDGALIEQYAKMKLGRDTNVTRVVIDCVRTGTNI